MTKRQSVLVTAFIFLFISACNPSSCHRGKEIQAPERVVLIVIDTLRRDHVSAYGYEKKTTPWIDRLASQGITFDRAVAPSSWTQPSIASLFTSTYPTVHHITMPPSKDASMSVLSSRFMTLGELMKKAGLSTRAISSQPWISPLSGFGQGFENFDLVSNMLDERESEKVFDKALEWLATSKKHHRFFLYLHVMGPHWPYNPAPEYQGKFTSVRVKKVTKLFKGKQLIEQYEVLTKTEKARFQSDPGLLA